MQIKPTSPQTLRPYKIDFAYGLDVKASFCLSGSMPCFTMFLIASMARSPSVFLHFSLSYKYKYIYRCIYLYIHTSHQLHQQIFTIKWTQSEKPCSKFTPQLQHLHHSHMEKNTCPPKWYPKKPQNPSCF